MAGEMTLKKANFKTAMFDCPDWKPITGYEGLYEVHWRGAVRNAENKLLLKPGLGGVGYFTVALAKNKLHKSFSIHSLVANHFIPKPEGKMWVNHKNGDKQNNHIANLEWMTPGENNSHAIKTGLRKSVWKAAGVIQYTLDGIEVARYRTSEDPIGFNSSLICRCCNKGMKYQHKGFRWAWINQPSKN